MKPRRAPACKVIIIETFAVSEFTSFARGYYFTRRRSLPSGITASRSLLGSILNEILKKKKAAGSARDIAADVIYRDSILDFTILLAAITLIVRSFTENNNKIIGVHNFVHHSICDIYVNCVATNNIIKHNFQT